MEGGIGQWEGSRSTLPLQPQQTTQKSRAHNRPFSVQLRSQHIHACICRLLPCASIFTMYCESLSACPMEINAGSSPLHSLVNLHNLYSMINKPSVSGNAFSTGAVCSALFIYHSLLSTVYRHSLLFTYHTLQKITIEGCVRCAMHAFLICALQSRTDRSRG